MPIRASHYLLAVPRPEPAVDAALLHNSGSLFDTLVTDSAGGTPVYPWRNRVKTDQSKFGGASMRFMGTILHVPDHADFAFGSGDFTLSFWVRFESGQVTGSRSFIGQWFRSDLSWLLQAETNLLRFYWSANGSAALGPLGGVFPWVADTWYHIEVNRASNVLYMYVDGNYIGGGAITETLRDSSRRVTIGANPNSGSFEQDQHVSIFRGWMDELIVFKGIAKHNTVPANWAPTAAFDNTDPDYASVDVLMHFDGSDASTIFTDEKGHFFAANGNAQIKTTQSKFGGASLGNMAAGTDCVSERAVIVDAAFPDSAPADPHFANVVSLLHFEGADGSTTFTDVTGKVWTAAGNAQIDTAQFRFGSASGLFDGNGDRISTPNHADFDFGSGDFTFECLVRPAALGTELGLTAKRASDVVHSPFHFSITTTGALQIAASTTGSSWAVLTSSSATLSAGVWTHVACQRKGNVLMGFYNGVLVVSAPLTGALMTNSNAVSVGALADNLFRPMNGWMDEVRFTKGVARYDYTPDFDIPINTPFTIECWVYINAFSTSHGIVGKFRSGNDPNDDTHVEWLWHFTSSTNLRLYYGHRGVNATSLDFTVAAVSTGAWHHVVLVRNSLNQLRAAVDGMWSSTIHTNGQALVNVSKNLVIGGSETAGFINAFNGFIDELRITPGVCRYSLANQNVFTPPVAAYDNTDPNYANAVLHTHFDGSDETYDVTDEKGKAVTIAHSTSYIATTRVKTNFGQSYYCNGGGRGSSINLQDWNRFRFGALDFTISFWIWLDVNFTGGAFLSKRATSSSFGPFHFHTEGYFSQRRLRFYLSSTGSSWNLINGGFFQNDMSGGFHYISVSRRGTNVYGHSGGVLRFNVNIGSVSLYDNTGVPVVIGNCQDGSEALAGHFYFDELRILKGAGLYDSNNYTPPTLPWS